MRMISNMKWTGLICGAILLGGRGLCAVVPASEPSAVPAPAGDAEAVNPYLVIVERNAFRLNPPPPPPAPPTKEAELPTVKFSGVMINRGKTNALFAVTSKPGAKPAKETPDTKYLSLSEGDRDPSGVELVKIMRGGENVEILNSGTRMVLNQKDNGFEEKSAPAGRGGPAPECGRWRRRFPNPSIPGGMPAAAPASFGAQSAGGSGGGIISSGGQGGGSGGIIGSGGISTSGYHAGSAPSASFPGSTQPTYAAEPSSSIRTSGAPVVATPVPTSQQPIPGFTKYDPSVGMPVNSTPPPSPPAPGIRMPPSPQ